MVNESQKELNEAVEKILESDSPKKLIVAGPGAGKTTLFKRLLGESKGNQYNRLVLTFVNNLKADLENSLQGLASVYTLHSYSQYLMYQFPKLRGELTQSFRCFPKLASLIKSDWVSLCETDSPKFVAMMRDLSIGDEWSFYEERSDFYDAVGFDDSVFRLLSSLRQTPNLAKRYLLVLIDEYQDFNALEAGLIDLLAEASPIVIAGDDDQALYSQLKGASWEYIRGLHNSEDYEVFVLPYCMRCPEVIVGAVNDVIKRGRDESRLEGRIEKPYKYFEPVKGQDSEKYPKIDLVWTTVQRKNANYFGKYIHQEIAKIPDEEINSANESGEPVVLIIGGKHHLGMIADHLQSVGRKVEMKNSQGIDLSFEDAYQILLEDPESNLAWRVVLHFGTDEDLKDYLQKCRQNGSRLCDEIPIEEKAKILAAAEDWSKNLESEEAEVEAVQDAESDEIRIKLTSYEGAKGLSAQHVYLVGLHENELPRDKNDIQDLEICKFLVGLTRAKRKCSILVTSRFANTITKPSVFLRWIDRERFNIVEINKEYWQ